MQRGFIYKHNIATGVNARIIAGYPEVLKEIMLFISWEMGVVISTRVGNPPRIDIPVLESTKAANIKTKTAPSRKGENDLFIVSPARGTIIVDQKVFGKTDSAGVPEGKGYNHVPYPTTLRDLFKYVEQGKLDVKIVNDEMHFETHGDFKPVATGDYENDHLKFTKSANPPSLTYSIKLADLHRTDIEGIFPVSLTEKEKKKLSPWRDNHELTQDSKAFLNHHHIDNHVLDKPIPLYYRHGEMPEFKVLEVVAKDNAIVIGDDDTLSMSPSIEFLDFIKKQYPNNPDIVHELMDTMGNFNDNDNSKETAKRLFMIEKLLCEYNVERLARYPHRKNEIEHWKVKLNELMRIQDPEQFYLNKYYKNGKFANIDCCGNDGMSAFELMISIQVNERFHTELKHIGQFIQHPPELRNKTVPSSLEDKAMHIWNGRFVLTHDENGLIAFYAQKNEGNTYAEKFPLLAEHFVEISPVWLARGGDKWWPIIAIQIELGQTNLINKDTLQTYHDYIKGKPELYELDSKGRAEHAEKQLAEQAHIVELSNLMDVSHSHEKQPTASAPNKNTDTKTTLHAAIAKKFYILKDTIDPKKSAPSIDKKLPSEKTKAANESLISRLKKLV